jgi:hypothetical protein
VTERKERRSYFRIDDVIGLSYEIIDEDKRPASEEKNDVERAFHRALADIDCELNRVTNLIWRENPAVAKALGILNKKIALVAAHCPPRGRDMIENHEEYTANISGSGMSFRSTEALPRDTRLNISAVLKPSNVQLQFNAWVVSCERVQDMPQELFLLRVRIAEEETAVKEQLVQHVVQKQSQNRVSARKTERELRAP